MHTDINQLIDHLNKLPNQIREAQKTVIEKREDLETAKLYLEVDTSQAMLKSERANATEKKAEAYMLTKETRLQLLLKQGALDRAENELEYLNNRFIALRKISSIEESLLKSQLGGS